MASEAPEMITYINGRRFVMPSGRAEDTLLVYLRGAPFREPFLAPFSGGARAASARRAGTTLAVALARVVFRGARWSR